MDKEQKTQSFSFCLPHTKVSRRVESKADEEQIEKVWEGMKYLCKYTWGRHRGAYAVAHSQIESEDPLRFFVTATGDIIVNPEILNRTKVLVPNEEACMTFPFEKRKKVFRSNKITVSFWRYLPGTGLQGPLEENINGLNAKVVQHEMDHMDGQYIYEIPEDPADAHKPPANRKKGKDKSVDIPGLEAVK